MNRRERHPPEHRCRAAGRRRRRPARNARTAGRGRAGVRLALDDVDHEGAAECTPPLGRPSAGWPAEARHPSALDRPDKTGRARVATSEHGHGRRRLVDPDDRRHVVLAGLAKERRARQRARGAGRRRLHDPSAARSELSRAPGRQHRPGSVPTLPRRRRTGSAAYGFDRLPRGGLGLVRLALGDDLTVGGAKTPAVLARAVGVHLERRRSSAAGRRRRAPDDGSPGVCGDRAGPGCHGEQLGVRHGRDEREVLGAERAGRVLLRPPVGLVQEAMRTGLGASCSGRLVVSSTTLRK